MTVANIKNKIHVPLDPGELLEQARRVVVHNPLGIFTTVNADHIPRSRWMVAVLAGPGLSRLYALTGRHTRKIRAISENGSVCWMFTGPHHEDVVTITGQAVMLSGLGQAGIDWSALTDATRQYAINALTDTQETDFAALETTIQTIEVISPRLGIYRPCNVPCEAPLRCPQDRAGVTLKGDRS